MGFIDWLMVFGYFGVLAAVVLVTLKKHKIQSGEDLLLGGRSVGWLAIGASLFAANIGSEHLIGLAGAGAVSGLSQSHWEFNSWIIVGMAWIFLPFYYKSGVSTMPEFIGRRFGERARWILTLVSLAAYVLTKIAVTVFVAGLFWKRTNLRGAVWGLSLGFVLGMAKLAVNALAPASAVATFQDYYFSGVLLVISFATVALASLSAPPPDESRLKGLNFSCLDANYRAENRASWNWIDVTVSIVVVGLVVSAYLYFFNWLEGGC